MKVRIGVFAFLISAALSAASVGSSAQTTSNLDVERVLYDFCSQGGVDCTDGIQPLAGLIEDASGNLYGISNGGGGTNSSGCNSGSCGYGTVFKLTPSSSGYGYAALYNFCSQPYCTDGAKPLGDLIVDAAGNFYGTTSMGGVNGRGTVFKLTPSGNGYTESVLYNFCSQSQGSALCTDGVTPVGLIEDSSGNLFGTTNWGGTGATLVNGGYGYGTVFMLAPSGSGYKYTVLYSFCPSSSTGICLDGAAPATGALVEDASGNLYGMTTLGGAGNHALGCNGIGCGTVFKLSPNSGGYVETVLYSFCSQGGSSCTDGGYPYAGLIEDASGNFYGTTSAGGVNSCDTPGCGTVFKLAPNGSGSYTESVLHSFVYTDGTGPDAGLIEDASGNFYGTTSNGGAGLSWRCEGCGSGTVFELSPSGSGYTETVLYNFCSQGGEACTDGVMPMAGVIEDASGNLYGTTWEGGIGNNWGTIFKLSPPPPGITVSASPTSLTIGAGQSMTATITVTPQNGFNSTVSLACSGLPANTTCSFSPPSVTPSGVATPTQLTIAVSAQASVARPASYSFLPTTGFAVVVCLFVGRRRRLIGKALFVLAMACASLVYGCGGSGAAGGSGGGGGGNSSPQSYVVTVTATSGTIHQAAQVTLTIN